MLMSLDIQEEIKKQRDWEFKDWKCVINHKADNFSMNSLIAASEKKILLNDYELHNKQLRNILTFY